MTDRTNRAELAEAFADFHRKNPRVFLLFRRFAYEAQAAGHKHFSADAVMHRVRWETSIETTGHVFKINNNHVAYYARRLMETSPPLKGFFHTRKVRSE